jgi:N utilization substance protein B
LKESFVTSSRRLAREWALRTLYQIDIAKTPRQEVLQTTLEALRHDFAQRSPKSVSGSRWEATCLETLSKSFPENLARLNPTLIKCLILGAERLVQEAPYWFELRLERSLKYHFKGIPFVPPTILNTLPNAEILPSDPASKDSLARAYFTLNTEEQQRYRLFIISCRQSLPEALEEEFRNLARTTAKTIAQKRDESPLGASLQDFLRTEREEILTPLQERWQKIGKILKKQLQDWTTTALFTQQITEGTLDTRKGIDLRIQQIANGWHLYRLVAVDRSILRLGCYELCYLPEIASAVTINEAVELAKKYSTAESGGFVNGVLGTIATNPIITSSEEEIDIEKMYPLENEK